MTASFVTVRVGRFAARSSIFLKTLVGLVRAAQVRAAFAVNRELVLLYWSIGRDLSHRFAAEEWGGKIIDRLATDLQTEFPGVEGFSQRNLRYMRSLAEAWPDEEILQQLVAKLPWSHNVRVLDGIKDRPTREWYLRAALDFGWCRDVLVLQIKSRLHEREGKALTNFPRALLPPDSDMAEQILKDPNNFDFLTVTATAKEREIERGLLTHLRDLLLELGRGFSFVDSQVPMTVGGQTFYIDLLFYHVRLHRYFVFELKVGLSSQNIAGKLSFSLAAVTRFIAAHARHRCSSPSTLCSSRSRRGRFAHGPAAHDGRSRPSTSGERRSALPHIRALAGEGIFGETAPRTFANNEVSRFLATGLPGSIRSILMFKGDAYFFSPFGEILYSIQTGESARTKILGMNGFEYLRRNPEVARVFDEAMTNITQLSPSAIASAYDFGRWGSLMELGGGNGNLLAAILDAHRGLRGVLADQPHVLSRARGFLNGELKARSTIVDCDFFSQVPSGCRA